MDARDGDIGGAWVAKARAELESADALIAGTHLISSDGSPVAPTFLVKGEPGPGDLESGVALGGEDGVAARKALEALGHDPDVVFSTLSRPWRADRGDRDPGDFVRRLALQIEAVDPSVIVALDGVAARDLGSATGLDDIPFGRAIGWRGRTLVAVDGLERSLSEPELKRAVWTQFRAVGQRSE
jgi:hypothetical protein